MPTALLLSCLRPLSASTSFISRPTPALSDDPLEDFVNHFISYILWLLNRSISMVLSGHDSFDLGHPLLIYYIENNEMISAPDQAALYRARLDILDQKLTTMNNLSRANIVVIAEIDVARARAKLFLIQEELKRKEATWAKEICEMEQVHRGVNNKLERARFEISETQNTIACTRDAIAMAQKILQTGELNFAETLNIEKNQYIKTSARGSRPN